MNFRKGTVRARRVILVPDIEASIEARSKILPRDHAGQFHELFIREIFPKSSDLLVGRRRRRSSERSRIVEDAFLELTKGGAVLVARQVAELLFADTVCSADGRVDVQSK